MKRRVAHLPLHSGKAPPWLFKRMTKLAGAVTMAIVEEFGPAEMLRRLSDPWWFQAFGCVLGFAIYHHSFFFTPARQWCVVQQGMDEECGWARRYHWLGESVEDFVCEPHAAVQDLSELPVESTPSMAGSGQRQLTLLNMVAEEAGENRRASTALVREPSGWLMDEIERLTEGPTLFAPARHPVLDLDVDRNRLNRILTSAHERNPQDFETLLGLQGIGPATVRSLALLAEIIFQAPPSRRDPTVSKYVGDAASQEDTHVAGGGRRWADYSYTHGGKDGTPFPVERDTYDRNVAVLTDAVRKARLGQNDKFEALRRLSRLEGPSAHTPSTITAR